MDSDLLVRWLNSGSFNLVFREFDNNFIRFNNKAITNFINNEPELVLTILMENIGSKERNIWLLAKFSMLEDKIYFKKAFHKVIISMNDLYCFLFYIKKMRGFGRIIRDTIAKWFHYTPTFRLIEFYEKTSYGYGWSFKDVLKEFHIKPKNKKEQELFKLAINSCNNEKEDTFISLIERHSNFSKINTRELEKFIYGCEQLINKKLNILASTKKIVHYIDPCNCFDSNVINTKITIKSLLKHLYDGFDFYTNSKLYDIENNKLNENNINFCKKPLNKVMVIENPIEDCDIIFVWSDKRNIRIKTSKPVVKVHLNISRLTNKKPEKNVYKILGFNDNTLELIGNILGDKI